MIKDLSICFKLNFWPCMFPNILDQVTIFIFDLGITSFQLFSYIAVPFMFTVINNLA